MTKKNVQQLQYKKYIKPSWAPPDWVFGPVWTVLYAIIAVSFGWVGYEYLQNALPLLVLLPFVLNLFFNIIFTPILFGMRNFVLASVDVVLVWITLVWALWIIYPIIPWVAYANLPYLAWVSFASVLQLTVARLNK